MLKGSTRKCQPSSGSAALQSAPVAPKTTNHFKHYMHRPKAVIKVEAKCPKTPQESYIHSFNTYPLKKEGLMYTPALMEAHAPLHLLAVGMHGENGVVSD